ncbi:hypothetical protein K9M06_05900 [Candidatus Bipolaricaulota bacterium]|nr:hypothetical protein [Candidatus Bipolaricaulota bacterium]MCF7890176.1 hypothetical protein [Candidatus Bipolaricaulota bacterium]
MPELNVECPHCGEETGTSKVVESKKFFRAIRIQEATTNCENCGKTITWGEKDVINEDDLG